jgi:hypothetical protein
VALTDLNFRLELLKKPTAVGLIGLTLLLDAKSGQGFPFKLLKRPITVGLVNLPVFLGARTGFSLPF